jgi:hypothetical protein
LTCFSPRFLVDFLTPKEEYAGGAIFYDLASKFVFVRHQTNLTSKMAINSKHSFERTANEFGVVVHEYVSDNHLFRSQDFQQDRENQQQKQSLSGVGAHHQNPVERYSQTIFNWARAMLLHNILHWPQQARLNLWPYAVDYSVWIWNKLPDASIRLAPLEKFAKASFPDYSHLHGTRVFGCPVFVLHPTLQDAKKLPKWQKKSWKGIFLGFSPQHSTNVYLVLNPETGSITPQFHVVFDEQFSTVMVDMSLDHDDALKVWDTLLDNGYDRHQCLEEFDEDEPRVHIRHPSAGVPLSRPISPPATTDNGRQNEIDPVVNVDSPTAIDAVPTQAEPETSYS